MRRPLSRLALGIARIKEARRCGVSAHPKRRAIRALQISRCIWGLLKEKEAPDG